MRGDEPVIRVIFRDVGIKQIKVDATNGQLPDLCKYIAPKELHGDDERFIVLANFSDRQVMKILIERNAFLPAFLVDLLFEITVAVEQSNRTEVQIKIAGAFAMISRENAQTAGVIRHAFMKAKLGGKI